jgi:hypothetical protein
MVARYAKTPPETNPATPEITFPARGRPVVRAMSNIAARAGTATAQSSMPNRPRRPTLRLLVAGPQKDTLVPEAVASDTSVGGVFVYRGA